MTRGHSCGNICSPLQTDPASVGWNKHSNLLLECVKVKVNGRLFPALFSLVVTMLPARMEQRVKGEQEQELSFDLEHEARWLVEAFLALGNGPTVYFSPLTAQNFVLTLAALLLGLHPAQSLFPQNLAA